MTVISAFITALKQVYQDVSWWVRYNVSDLLPDSMLPSHESCCVDTEEVKLEYMWHAVITQARPLGNNLFEPLSPDDLDSIVMDGIEELGQNEYITERTVRHVYGDAVYLEKMNFNLSAATNFRVAAFYGHPAAQYYLAKMFMYSDDLALPQDFWHIAKWLRKAAVQGHEDAQRELASHADFMRSIGLEQIGEFIDKGFITAVQAKDKQLLDTAACGRPDQVAYQIAKGANVYAVDEDERTPLMRAAQSNPNPNIFKILICNGSELNAEFREAMLADPRRYA